MKEHDLKLLPKEVYEQLYAGCETIERINERTRIALDLIRSGYLPFYAVSQDNNNDK